MKTKITKWVCMVLCVLSCSSIVVAGTNNSKAISPVIMFLLSEDIKHGMLLDSFVENIYYVTNTQTGLTDAEGRYRYVEGESVKFYIGLPENGLLVGESTARGVITPKDFEFLATSVNTQQTINRIKFLLALDEDQNYDNGIQIPDRIHQLSIGLSIDFSLDSVQFDIDANLILDTLYEGAFHPSLQDNSFTQDAIAHFSETFAALAEEWQCGNLDNPVDTNKLLLFYGIDENDLTQAGIFSRTPENCAEKKAMRVVWPMFAKLIDSQIALNRSLREGEGTELEINEAIFNSIKVALQLSNYAPNATSLLTGGSSGIHGVKDAVVLALDTGGVLVSLYGISSSGSSKQKQIMIGATLEFLKVSSFTLSPPGPFGQVLLVAGAGVDVARIINGARAVITASGYQETINDNLMLKGMLFRFINNGFNLTATATSYGLSEWDIDLVIDKESENLNFDGFFPGKDFNRNNIAQSFFEFTNKILDQTLATTLLTPPEITSTVFHDDAIIKWKALIGHSGSYDVYWKEVNTYIEATDKDLSTHTKIPFITAREYSLTNLNPHSLYSVQVLPVGYHVEAVPQTPHVIHTGSLDKPTDPVLTEVNGSLHVSWDAVPDAITYDVKCGMYALKDNVFDQITASSTDIEICGYSNPNDPYCDGVLTPVFFANIEGRTVFEQQGIAVPEITINTLGSERLSQYSQGTLVMPNPEKTDNSKFFKHAAYFCSVVATRKGSVICELPDNPLVSQLSSSSTGCRSDESASSSNNIDDTEATIEMFVFQKSEFLQELSISVSNITEGDSGSSNAEAAVTLSGQSNQTVTVNFQTQDITATAGSDYTAVSQQVVFASGETSKTVNVQIFGDTTVEPDEQLKLVISNPVNANLLISETNLTILNDDSVILPLPAPDGLTATAEDTAVSLNWNSVANATSYRVHRALETFGVLDPANYSTLSGYNSTVVVITNHTETSLTNETTYYFVVTSVESSEESGASSEVSATPSIPQAPSAVPLNDTGIIWGGNYPNGNNATCIGETIAQQDCSYGRDVTNNDDTDGHVGFSFIKISDAGAELAAGVSIWSCIKDNVTGLTWEKKTDDNTEHDKDNTYQWGGLTAQGRDNANREGTYYDDWNALVNDANNSNFCGYTDWRVPTLKELQSLVHRGTTNPPSIDTGYFPNTVGSGYWTSSPDASNSSSAWSINYLVGLDNNHRRYTYYSVRLVR